MPPLTVLVATSGDTGSAVAHAFHGVAGTRVVVLYPEGTGQRRAGGAVHDARRQRHGRRGRGARSTIASGWRKRPSRIATLQSRLRLTSANSISLGRLLPQMFYYAYAALQSSADAADDLRAERQLRQSRGRRDGVEARRADRRRSPRRRRSTTRCRATSRPAASSRGRRCRRSPTRWTSAIPATSSACSGCSTAMSARCERSSRPTAHTDDEVRAAIASCSSRFGYVADPHTAIAYLGHARSSGLDCHCSWRPRIRRNSAKSSSRSSERPVPLPEALAARLARKKVVQRIRPALASWRTCYDRVDVLAAAPAPSTSFPPVTPSTRSTPGT